MTSRLRIINNGDQQTIIDENGNFYARTYSTFDARVIAAGPDLLEACKLAVWELRGGRGIPIDIQRISDDLNIIIDKAEGRTKP